MLVVSAKKSPNIGSTNEIFFGLVSKPPERILCTTMFSCRDYLNDYLLWVSKGMQLGYGGDLTWLAQSTTSPDLDRLRLLIGVRNTSDVKKKLFFAKKIISIFEKEIGFSTSSKITSIKLATTDSTKNENYLFLLLTGPSEWMLTPQTLSMATFIFKSCFFTDYSIIEKYEDISTIEDIKKYFQDVYNTHSNKSYRSSYVGAYVKIFSNKIDFITENFNKMFLPVELEKRFPTKYTAVHNDWGILHFLEKGDPTNMELNNRYKEAISNFKNNHKEEGN